MFGLLVSYSARCGALVDFWRRAVSRFSPAIWSSKIKILAGLHFV